MTKDERISSYKYSVLQHAREHKNITYTCQVLNLSRTTYYKWLKQFVKFGYPGLQDRIKAKPKMPNQIKPDKEKIILNYIINYPTHGPKRIANELKQQGIAISRYRSLQGLKKKKLKSSSL